MFSRGWNRTLKALRDAGKRVVIVGPIPEVGHDVPRVLARQLRSGTFQDVAPTYIDFSIRQRFVLPTLRFLSGTYEATLVLPHESLCRDGVCSIDDEGNPLYSDAHHLSIAGARSLAPLFGPIFR